MIFKVIAVLSHSDFFRIKKDFNYFYQVDNQGTG